MFGLPDNLTGTMCDSISAQGTRFILGLILQLVVKKIKSSGQIATE